MFWKQKVYFKNWTTKHFFEFVKIPRAKNISYREYLPQHTSISHKQLGIRIIGDKLK
jgi:hypothetical protein